MTQKNLEVRPRDRDAVETLETGSGRDAKNWQEVDHTDDEEYRCRQYFHAVSAALTRSCARNARGPRARHIVRS